MVIFKHLKCVSFHVSFFLLCVLLPFPLILIALLIVIIFNLIRSIAWVLAKIFRSDLRCLVSGANSVFAIKNSASFPLNIIGIAFLNGNMEIDLLRRDITDRVFTLQKPNGEFFYAGLKTYWVSFLSLPFWKEELNFDVKNHVRDYDYTGKLALSNSPSEIDLQNVIGKLLRAPWKKDQSPWEILLVHNYQDENKTVLIIRIDHVLCDGLSIYKMFQVITESTWGLPELKMSGRNLTRFQRWGLSLRIPYDLIQTMYLLYGERPLPFQKNDPFHELIFSMSPNISVEVIKSIKNHFQVSYAAVVYSAVCATVARAYKASGQNVPKNVVTSIVLPLPNHPGGLCIHAGIIVTKWPLQFDDPKELVEKVHKALVSVSKSTQTPVSHSLGKAAGFIPMNLLSKSTDWFPRSNLFGVANSNVPVTTGPVYYRGIEMVELTTANSNIMGVGIFVSLGGFNNKQRASFSVNSNMFASEEIAQSFGTFFAEEIQALANATI